MEVWSRLWLSVVIGRRSFANVKLVLRKAVHNGKYMKRFLFTSDGFDPYAWAVKQILLPLCSPAPDVEVREPGQDSRNAGRNRFEKAVIPGNIYRSARFIFVRSGENQ